MKKITSTAELKNAILLLEEKQAIQGKLLKRQFHGTSECLRPGNITKHLFSRFSASTDFKIGITTAAMSLAAFYFARRAIVRSTQRPLKMLLGTLIQSGISNIVQHPEAVKSIGQVLMQHLLGKRKTSKV